MFWAYLDGEGQELGRSQVFADLTTAEDWIRTSWPDLAENGVEEVVLNDEANGVRLYRMGLAFE